jgi:hypothetical protein
MRVSEPSDRRNCRRWVRLLPNGFAVKFVEKQNRNDLNRLIARPALLLPSARRTKAAPSSSIRAAAT